MNDARLAAARLWAATQLPYFAAGLFALAPIESPGLGTFAVDRRWRLYVDPDVLERWTVPEAGAVLVHELSHVLRAHAERGEALGVGWLNALAWNVACDAEINDDLVALGLPLPSPVLPETIGCSDGELAERYYASLPVEPVQIVDCGSGVHAHGRGWEVDDDRGLDPVDAALVRQRVKHEVRVAQAAGRLPKGLTRWAEADPEPPFDWRRALAAEVRRAVHLAAGRVDYSHRRPSRRAAAVPHVVLPSFARPVPAVAVVVDTSGSMGRDDLRACLREIDGIIDGVGLRTAGVRVLACDVDVHAVTKVVVADRASLVGGGGTDMVAGIRAALELRPRPEVVIVLTDGYTPWPAQPPTGVRVVVGVLAGGDAAGAPAWARVVPIAA